MSTESVIPQPPAPTVAIFPPPPPPLAELKFPLGWLLDHAAAPIKFRSLMPTSGQLVWSINKT